MQWLYRILIIFVPYGNTIHKLNIPQPLFQALGMQQLWLKNLINPIRMLGVAVI